MLPKSSSTEAKKLLLKLFIDLFSGSHSEPVAAHRGSEVKGGYLPRNAEGGEGGGSDTPGREEERRKGKTEKETNRVTQYFIQEKIE